jgi:hypothetical protein
MRRVNSYVHNEAIVKLKELAKKTGLNVSEHIRRAIDEYLKKRVGK